jgi:hypothetical protein
MIQSKAKFITIALLIILAMSTFAGISLLPTVTAQTPPNGPWVDEINFFIERDEARS